MKRDKRELDLRKDLKRPCDLSPEQVELVQVPPGSSAWSTERATRTQAKPTGTPSTCQGPPLVFSINNDPEAASLKACDIVLVAELGPAPEALEDGLRSLASDFGAVTYTVFRCDCVSLSSGRTVQERKTYVYEPDVR